MIDKTFKDGDYRVSVIGDKVIFGVRKDDGKHPVTNIQFPLEDLNMVRNLFSEAINNVTDNDTTLRCNIDNNTFLFSEDESDGHYRLIINNFMIFSMTKEDCIDLINDINRVLK